MGYSSRTIHGLSWAWAQSIFIRGISLLKILILARILTPREFGDFGISLLILALLETLTETGVNVFLIQKKENLSKYINSAWIVSIARGFIIFFVFIIFSGFIADFFKAPHIKNILILFSFVPLIRGFINPAEIKFQKEINFDKDFIYRMSIAFIDMLATIFLVLIIKNISGLVIGMLTGVIFQVILSFLLIKPRPQIKFKRLYIYRIINQGKWVTLSGIFNYLFHNLDNIIVGKFLGTYNLGLYEMSYNIAMLPITDVADVISRVTFPVYSKFSDDLERLRKAFLKTELLLILITVPFGFVVFFFANGLIEFFLGKQWLPMVNILKILVVLGVVHSIFGFPAIVFLSVNKQIYSSIITLINLIVLVICIFPLITYFGLLGVAFAALLGVIVPIPVSLYFLRKIFNNK